MTTHLSVNLNKVALVRNTRHLGIPSVTRAATLCLQAGAAGITVHPRPDARHIRADDVIDLAALLQDWPDREFNVEGNPFHNLMDCVADLVARKLPVHQVTFVPDSEGQFTSDHGWTFPQDADRLKPLINQAHALGLRVSLFMDAEPEPMAAARAVGALIAVRLKGKGLEEVVFDRGGFPYHGRIKAVADAAREKGLKF